MTGTQETILPEGLNATIEPFRMTGDLPALFGALAQAQLNFQPILKNKTAKVQTKTGGSYEFHYASLESVLDATRPALNAAGLSLLQPFYSEDKGYVLKTILAHSSGARIEAEVYMPRPDDVQKFGSALTYLKRYQVQCLLGVNSEDDDDGNAADGHKAEVTQRQSQQPPAPQQKKKQQQAKQEPKSPAEPPRTEPLPDVTTEAQEVPAETMAVPQTELPSSNGVGIVPEAEPETEVMATKETNAAIKKVFQQFRFNKDGATKFCADVTKKAPADLTENDAQRLLSHLRDGGFLTQWLSANKQATQ